MIAKSVLNFENDHYHNSITNSIKLFYGFGPDFCLIDYALFGLG